MLLSEHVEGLLKTINEYSKTGLIAAFDLYKKAEKVSNTYVIV